MLCSMINRLEEIDAQNNTYRVPSCTTQVDSWTLFRKILIYKRGHAMGQKHQKLFKLIFHSSFA